jgi:hypothetical protein
MIKHIALLSTCLLTVLSDAAHSADMPKRRPGLWEIRTNMPGTAADRGPVQHCIDERTDNLMQEQASRHQPNCPVKDIQRDGERIVVHSVCKMGETSVTSDAVFTGKFDSAYRGQIKVRYDPPVQGRSQAEITQEAKWIGSCKPGQKPGDIIMPGFGTVNPNEAHNKARIQEAINKMQKQRSGTE